MIEECKLRENELHEELLFCMFDGGEVKGGDNEIQDGGGCDYELYFLCDSLFLVESDALSGL